MREKTEGTTVLSVSRLAALVLLVLAGVCFADPDTEKPSAQTQPSEKQLADARAVLRQRLDPISPEEKRHIDKLIGDLDSNLWKVRNKASGKLSQLRPELMPLVKQASESKDPEVAVRAGLAVEALQKRADKIACVLNPAIDTLVAARDKKIISMLIELLGHTNQCVRYSAGYALRRLTRENFDYDSYDEPAKRAEAVEKWKRWWKKNEAGFEFKETAWEAFGLLICDDQDRKLTFVTPEGRVIWSDDLSRKACCAAMLPGGNYLVGYYEGAKNVVEYDRTGKAVWDNEKAGLGKKAIYDVQRLTNGNTLIAYTYNGYVSEITPAGKVVWQKKNLGMPASAQRLANGNTLICELHGRVSEVDRQGKIVWSKTGLRGPYDASKLPNGNVLIAESSARRVIEVNMTGKIVWQCKCASDTRSACRLPDGTTAIRVRGRSVITVDQKGRKIHQLVEDKGSIGRVRLVPAAVLKQKQPTTSTKPA